MGGIENPFIVMLRFAFQTRQKLYLVTDYCRGGELFFHLKKYVFPSTTQLSTQNAKLVVALVSLPLLALNDASSLAVVQTLRALHSATRSSIPRQPPDTLDVWSLLRRMHRFSERMVQFYAAELICAIKALHDNDIVYR